MYRIHKFYANETVNSGKFTDNNIMFEKEIFQVLKHVVTSWQVIVISIALVLYLNIVFYVAKAYHSPRFKKININIKRKKKNEAVVVADASGGDAENDELGLEEA